MMPGTPQPRPPEWLPSKDELKPEEPNLIHRLANWDVRARILLSIWYRLCCFVISGLGVFALITVMWFPSKLEATIKLISLVKLPDNAFILPATIIIAVVYVSRSVVKIISKRNNIEEQSISET